MEFLLLIHDAPDRMPGDIIHVAEDGTAWGGMENLDPGDESSFLVVCIDVPIEEARVLCVPLTRGVFDVNQELVQEVVYPSKYYVDLNDSLAYDDLARLYAVDWDVPTIPITAIKEKSL